jgi:hypothetical protein
VVGLADDGEAAAGEAFDEVHLPQRPGPVQRPALHPGDQLGELMVVAGTGQRGAAHVVADVEVLVVDPHGVRQPAGHPADPLPVPRHERDALRDELDQPVVVETVLRRLEDRDATDVHRRRRLLEVEERHVQRAQPVGHAMHGGMTPEPT